MDIAAIIKERRARLGLSQQDLAEFAEVGIATVKDIERGKGNPTLHTLQKIMTVLGLEMIIQTKETQLLAHHQPTMPVVCAKRIIKDYSSHLVFLYFCTRKGINSQSTIFLYPK